MAENLSKKSFKKYYFFGGGFIILCLIIFVIIKYSDAVAEARLLENELREQKIKDSLNKVAIEKERIDNENKQKEIELRNQEEKKRLEEIANEDPQEKIFRIEASNIHNFLTLKSNYEKNVIRDDRLFCNLTNTAKMTRFSNPKILITWFDYRSNLLKRETKTIEVILPVNSTNTYEIVLSHSPSNTYFVESKLLDALPVRNIGANYSNSNRKSFN